MKFVKFHVIKRNFVIQWLPATVILRIILMNISTGISNLLQLAQAEVVLGGPAFYVFSFLGQYR